ncbi:MAG: cysteine hydrolase family protein [Alphaproteobacteria bacterium]
MNKPREIDSVLTRERPLDPARTALLLIDVQNVVLDEPKAVENAYFRTEALERVIPNLKSLIDGCRSAGAEVMYTVMENLTKDGRDRGLDYKLSGFFIAKGSREAKVIDAVAPGDDDIVLPKTSSSLFNSTNVDYLLRNIGIDTLAVTGFLTDQCVDHTLRDAADRGYYPVCIADACATHTPERHEDALKLFGGYCRTMTTDAFLAELRGG